MFIVVVLLVAIQSLSRITLQVPLGNDPSSQENRKGREPGEDGPEGTWFDGVHDFEGCGFEGFEVGGVVDDMVCIVDFFDEWPLCVDARQSIFL